MPSDPETSGSEPDPGIGGRSITGLESRRAAALAVLSGWVGAVFLFLNDHDDAFVRFYSLQTLAHFGLFLACCAIAAALSNLSDFFALGLRFPLLILCILPVFCFYWLRMLLSAWRGQVLLLPLVGKWCRLQARL